MELVTGDDHLSFDVISNDLEHWFSSEPQDRTTCFGGLVKEVTTATCRFDGPTTAKNSKRKARMTILLRLRLTDRTPKERTVEAILILIR